LSITKLKEHTDRDEEFVREYVRNGGNATQAALTCGVSDTSASTIGYRLKNRLGVEIDAEQREILRGYAPKAFEQMRNLAENAESENVRLKANSDLLDRAGYRPIDKSEITQMNEFENMTTEEMQAELDALYAKQGYKVVKG
jgi:phage terminase small subunit